jgi:hypothetical protein
MILDRLNARLWRLVKAPEVRYSVMLLVVTRIILSAGAYVVTKLITPLLASSTPHLECLAIKPSFSSHALLSLWGNFDTEWYVNIASQGYAATVAGAEGARWAFFPLYPLLMHWLAPLLANNFYLAGLVIANLSLLSSCIVLYRLVRLDSDADVAKRAVKYFVLLPTAFLLSAALTESLFLFLALLTLYFGRTNRWWLAGLAAFLLALTRTTGIVILLPLAIMYARQIEWNWRRVRINSLSLAAPIAGLAVFAAYCYARTGDALAFAHVGSTFWGHKFVEPFGILFTGLMDTSVGTRLQAVMTLLNLGLLVAFIRRIRIEYWLFAVIILLFSATIGNSMHSMLRYIIVAFPTAIILALISVRKNVDEMLTIGLALSQAFLMVLWASCWLFVVV